MAEKEPGFNVEDGNEDTRLTRAINGADSILSMIKLLEESERTEIKDVNGDFYYVENIVSDLNNLEDLVRDSENVEKLNSLESHGKIIAFLKRIPNNFNLRQHTLRLLTFINPEMKKFTF